MRATPLIAVGLIMVASVLRADTIELVNGDRLNGQVASLDTKQLTLRSEILGEMVIPREKVASIHLGDRRPPKSQPATPTPGNRQADMLKALEGLNGGRNAAASGKAGQASVNDLLKQLQAGGVDPRDMKQLQDQFPLLATPAVQQYFNKTVGGLIRGDLDINDLRRQAVDARDQLNEVRKDLGPQGAALDGYLSILDSFIDQTAPPTPKQNAKKR